MDQELRDRLAAFADLDDGPLATLVADVAAAYATIRAGENPRAELATLTELAGAREYLVAVQSERETAAAALDAEIAALDAQFEASDAEPEPEEEAEEVPAEEPEEEAEAVEEPAEVEEAPEPAMAAASPAVRPTAAAAAAHVPADRRARPKTPAKVGRVVSLAGGAIGNPVDGLAEIGKLVAYQASNFIGAGAGGGGEKVPVARIIAEYPEERILGFGDGYAEGNQAKIEAVGAGGPIPLAASGGICIPAQPYYAQEVVATDVRPVVGALQPFQTRGGVSFIPPTSVADYAPAEWTLAQDEAVTSSDSTWKAVENITCGTVTTVRPHGVYWIGEIGNLNEMTHPERVAAEMANAMAAYARLADSLLLRDIRSGSTRFNGSAYASGQAIGAARDTLVSMGQAAAGYRNRFRMDPSATLNVLAPAWLRDAIQLDLAVQQPGDAAFVNGVSEVAGYLAAVNVRPYWYLDSPPVPPGAGTGPSQYFATPTADTAIPAFPGYAQWAMFHDGAWLYGDQGEINLGPVRDSILNRRNAFQMFVEGFELAAMVGVASYWVTQIVAIAGGFGTGEDLGS